jgi:hypothetical protein
MPPDFPRPQALDCPTWHQLHHNQGPSELLSRARMRSASRDLPFSAFFRPQKKPPFVADSCSAPENHTFAPLAFGRRPFSGVHFINSLDGACISQGAQEGPFRCLGCGILGQKSFCTKSGIQQTEIHIRFLVGRPTKHQKSGSRVRSSSHHSME